MSAMDMKGLADALPAAEAPKVVPRLGPQRRAKKKAPAKTAESKQASSEAKIQASVWLFDVHWFLEDLDHDIWWLLRASHQFPDTHVLTGEEQLGHLPTPLEDIYQGLFQRKRLSTRSVRRKQSKDKERVATLFLDLNQEEWEFLQKVGKLQFKARSSVFVFKCNQEVDIEQQYWEQVYNLQGKKEQWFLNPKSEPPTSRHGVRAAMICPMYITPAGKLWTLMTCDEKKGSWQWPGGNTCPFLDDSYQTAGFREFHEETMGHFKILDKDGDVKWIPHKRDESSMFAAGFTLASPEMFSNVQESQPDFNLRTGVDSSNYVEILPGDDKDTRKKKMRELHSQGKIYLEHTRVRWFLVAESGQIMFDPKGTPSPKFEFGLSNKAGERFLQVDEEIMRLHRKAIRIFCES